MQTAHNNSSNDTPFMIEEDYSGRSMCRLHRELIVNSSAAHCVATADVRRKPAALFRVSVPIKKDQT